MTLAEAIDHITDTLLALMVESVVEQADPSRAAAAIEPYRGVLRDLIAEQVYQQTVWARALVRRYLMEQAEERAA